MRHSPTSTRSSLAQRIYRHGMATLGVQSYMLDASVRMLAYVSRRFGLEAEAMSPPPWADHTHAGRPEGAHAPDLTGPGQLEPTADGLSAGGGFAPGGLEGVPPTPPASGDSSSVAAGGADLQAPPPHSALHSAPHSAPRALSTEAGLREAILELREAIAHLDDVQAFDTIRAIDNDMYHLWKELERKMQRHRQSEAKAQLKDMFTI